MTPLWDSSSQSGTTPSFPFPTEADDHCESPLYAYEHVVAILQALYRRSESTIYDPYYCHGGVVRNLNSLGFANVYNVKEDCYKVWQQQHQLPSFDILVTNPPYSGDHVSQLLFVVKLHCIKPFVEFPPFLTVIILD